MIEQTRKPLCVLLAFCCVFYCDGLFTPAHARVSDSTLRRTASAANRFSQNGPGGSSGSVLFVLVTVEYHVDGQMSTRQLTDASANVTDTYTFDAFGVTLAQTGSTANNYLYTGEQFDPNVAFYYLRERYLNQRAGRFVSQDPFQGTQDPATLHKYLYANANPVMHRDPSGRQGLLIALAGLVLFVLLLLLIVLLPGPRPGRPKMTLNIRAVIVEGSGWTAADATNYLKQAGASWDATADIQFKIMSTPEVFKGAKIGNDDLPASLFHKLSLTASGDLGMAARTLVQHADTADTVTVIFTDDLTSPGLIVFGRTVLDTSHPVILLARRAVPLDLAHEVSHVLLGPAEQLPAGIFGSNTLRTGFRQTAAYLRDDQIEYSRRTLGRLQESRYSVGVIDMTNGPK